MRYALLLPLALLAIGGSLAGCQQNPPVRSVGGTPIGTDATTGQPSLTSAGAHEVNRDYNLGTDPNFPGFRRTR